MDVGQFSGEPRYILCGVLDCAIVFGSCFYLFVIVKGSINFRGFKNWYQNIRESSVFQFFNLGQW